MYINIFKYMNSLNIIVKSLNQCLKKNYSMKIFKFIIINKNKLRFFLKESKI